MLDANESLDPQAGGPPRRRARAHPGSHLGRGAGPALGRRGPGRRRPGHPGLGRHRREPHRAGAVPPAAGGRARSTSSRRPRSGASPTSCGSPRWRTPTTCRSARSAPPRSGCCTPRRRCRTTSPASCRICSRRVGVTVDLHVEDGAFVLGDSPGLGIHDRRESDQRAPVASWHANPARAPRAARTCRPTFTRRRARPSRKNAPGRSHLDGDVTSRPPHFMGGLGVIRRIWLESKARGDRGSSGRSIRDNGEISRAMCGGYRW